MGKFHFWLCTYYAMLLINNGVRHSMDLVLDSQERKFRAFYHVSSDMIISHGKPVGSANCTWTIRSGGRDQDLHVYGLINLGKFCHHFLTQSGVPFSHIHDILYHYIKLIACRDSIKADTIVTIT